MKLLSRNTLVAAATSIALVTGSLAAPAMAQDATAANEGSSQSSTTDSTSTGDSSSSFTSFVDSVSASSDSVTNSEAFKWFSVVAAIISAVAAGLTFALKLQSILKF